MPALLGETEWGLAALSHLTAACCGAAHIWPAASEQPAALAGARFCQCFRCRLLLSAGLTHVYRVLAASTLQCC